MEPIDCQLDQLLNRKTVAELRPMGKGFKLPRYSKLRKAELIRGIRRELLDPNRLCELLYVLEPPVYQLFRQAAQAQEPIQIPQLPSPQCKVLAGFCYLTFTECPDGGYQVLVPQEVRALFRPFLSPEFQAQKERFDLLHHYALAAVNLYGCIHIQAFLEIFNRQNPEHTSTQELFPVLIRHISAGVSYGFWKGYLLSDAFKRNDFQEVPLLLQAAADKPRYIPPREEFLHYADWEYYEETEQIQALRRFLLQECGQSEESARAILADVHFACAIKAGIPRMLSMFRQRHVQLRPEQITELTHLIVDVSNHTRIWADNGHTPNELYRRHDFLNGQPRQKVGRNDPCPCGSGKKYKKCCGRG